MATNLIHRLPNSFEDAKNLIKKVIEKKNSLSIRDFKSEFPSLADITHFYLEEPQSPSTQGYANLDLVLQYNQLMLQPDSGLKTVERTKKLRLLSSEGDNQWTFRMKNLVWEGVYPTCVAIDLETAEVILVFLHSDELELVHFSYLDEVEFETFQFDVNDREPYSIRINEQAMFDYIDGKEGIKTLYEGIKIRFQCSIPITVHYQKPLDRDAEKVEREQESEE